MPAPRGAGRRVDLMEDPDAMRPKTTQHPGLIKRAISAYTGGVAGKGPEDSSREGTGREGDPSGAPKPAQVSEEPSGWAQTQKVIETIFPGTEPLFKAGAMIGDYLGKAQTTKRQAATTAGYAPMLPATASLDWARSLENSENP